MNTAGSLSLMASFGLAPTVLIGDSTRAQEPALADAVYGGIRFPAERHLRPAAMARGLHRRCLELGVEIVEHAPVDGVEWRGTRVTAVSAGTRRFAADAFLLAAGAWSGPLSKRFGVALPVRPGKGYSVDVPAVGLRSPIYLSEARVAVTPLDTKLRLAGTMEFGGLDERIDPVRIGAIRRAPQAYFREWSVTVEPQVGAGMRPMTPDGLPIIGHLGGLANVYVSTGHAMLGLTLAPSTAAAIAELMLTGHSSPVLAPFSAERF